MLNSYRDQYQQALQRDPLLRQAESLCEAGHFSDVDALKLVTVELLKRCERLTTQLDAAQMIAPSRIRMPGGMILRYDVPDSLVPIETFGRLQIDSDTPCDNPTDC